VGLDKRWQMPWKESHSLQFRWEVFDALNLTRFDVQTLNLSITNAATFGTCTGLLTNPRTMQFALRYELLTVGARKLPLGKAACPAAYVL
jgi:hypothetical protein